MVRYLVLTVILLASMPLGSNAQQINQGQNSGQTPSYTAAQGYIQRSYPPEFDQEYHVPTKYNNQYYPQEPEGVVGNYNNQKTAQTETPHYQQQYYYYY